MSTVNTGTTFTVRIKRSAAKITKTQLSDIIGKLLTEQSYIDKEDWTPGVLLKDEHICLDGIIENCKTVEKDFSLLFFNYEDATVEPYTPAGEKSNLLGFHTLPNGFTFVGFNTGSHGQVPMFLIVYWDGIYLRGYIPLAGNLFNLDFMCAFGLEESSPRGPNGTDACLMKQEYILEDPKTFTEIYLAKQGVPKDDLIKGNLRFDWVCIFKEIMTSIKPI